jgi:hypothetical protein
MLLTEVDKAIKIDAFVFYVLFIPSKPELRNKSDLNIIASGDLFETFFIDQLWNVIVVNDDTENPELSFSKTYSFSENHKLRKEWCCGCLPVDGSGQLLSIWFIWHTARRTGEHHKPETIFLILQLLVLE